MYLLSTQAEDHIFLNDLKKLREKFEVHCTNLWHLHIIVSQARPSLRKDGLRD